MAGYSTAIAAEALGDSQDRLWTGSARLDAVIHTASLDEEGRSAWCREEGVCLAKLEYWRAQTSESLSDPASGAASSKAARKLFPGLANYWDHE